MTRREVDQPASAAPPATTASRAGRLARGILAVEPVILLGLAPLVWFPRAWTFLAVAVIVGLWGLRLAVHRRLSVRTPYDVWVVGLLLFLPLTVFPVVDWGESGPKYLGLLYGLALVYGFANALTTPLRLRLGLAGVGVVLAGGLALVGLFGTDWLPSKVLPLDWLYPRIPALVQGVTDSGSRGGVHPNQTGGTLALLTPLVLALALAGGSSRLPRPRLVQGALAGVFVLCLAVLVLTQSRSAYVGAAAGLWLVAAWWLLADGARRRRFMGLAVLTPATVLGVWAGWQLFAGWVGLEGGGIDSYQGRVELWQRAWLMLQDFPFTGIGPGQFQIVVQALYPTFLIPPSEPLPHAHNFLLQVGLDLGIPGAANLVLMLVAYIGAVVVVAVRSRDRFFRAAAVGLLAGMAAFHVYGLTDAIAVGARGALPFWVLLGLGAAVSRIGPESRVPRAEE